MPRARPGARKTTARRRIFRYRTKWTHHVIPVRIKELLDHMEDEWEDEDKGDAPVFVECEEPTMAELETKGVPEAEWPYYLGYMKRMLALYRAYTSETLQLEKTNLIEEYVLRGKDRDVLEQVQEVAAECAGVPIPPLVCPDGEQIVNRGFETGDFTGWAHSVLVHIDNLAPHGGVFYCVIDAFDHWIKQTLSVPLPVACVQTFKAYVWLAGPVWTNLGKIIVGYTDGSTSEMTVTGIGGWDEQDIKPILVSGKTISYVKFLAVTGGTRPTCGGYAVDDVTLISTQP